MQRKRLSILLLSLVIISGLTVAVIQLAPASAARAADVTVVTSHFKDLSATADFQTSSGCVDTFVSVGADASSAGIYIERFDHCRGHFLTAKMG